MGSSGAGKTTLLNILSDRISKIKRGTNLEGKVMVNDSLELTHEIFGTLAGYSMQDDILYNHFTPKEALLFAVEMKLQVSK